MKSLYEVKVAVKRRFWFLFGFHYGKFGKKSCIYKPLCVIGKKNIRIEDNVFIRNGARIECVSRWGKEKYLPEISIGRGTVIEQSSHIISAGKLSIGEGNVISSNVFISNVEHFFGEIDKSVLDQSLIVNDVQIGNYCFIGTGVKILSGSCIGNNVIIGAGSVVKGNIPDYSVVVGTPARVVKKYNFETKQWERIESVKQ